MAMDTESFAAHLRALGKLQADLWGVVASGEALNKTARMLAERTSLLDAGLRCLADDADLLGNVRHALGEST